MKESLPEVEYQPMKKIIVHQQVKYTDWNTFLQNVVGQHTPQIGWCNGYAYSVGRFHPIDDLTLQLLEGTDHIASIYYCAFPEFKPSVKTKDNFEVQIIDQSNEPFMMAVTKYLKSLEP